MIELNNTISNDIEQLNKFIRLNSLSEIEFSEFVNFVHAYLNSDFKFDYITICNSPKNASLSDLVIHKADLTFLISGKTLAQLYDTAISQNLKPLDVMHNIYFNIEKTINDTFYIKPSILSKINNKEYCKIDNRNISEVNND